MSYMRHRCGTLYITIYTSSYRMEPNATMTEVTCSDFQSELVHYRKDDRYTTCPECGKPLLDEEMRPVSPTFEQIMREGVI